MRYAILVLITMLQQVLLGATFTSSTTAAITWQQPPGVVETCLRRVYGAEWPAGICWRNLEAGEMRVDLPGIYDKRWYTPAYGDRYILSFEGVDVGQATLGEAVVYTLYMPLAVKHDTPERAYLPVVLH